MSLKRYWHYLLLPPSALLLWYAFRDFPISAFRSLLLSFGISGLLLLVSYESAAWVLMGERWRFFCRENGAPVGLVTANAARLAGFTWSYITPGPHVGGEPAQLHFLSRRHFPISQTLPALLRDRGFELFSGLLTASCLIFLQGGDSRAGWIFALIAAILLTGAVVSTYSRKAFRSIVAVVFRFSGNRAARNRRIHHFLKDLINPVAKKQRSAFIHILLFLSIFLPPMLIFGELGLFFRLSGSPLAWRSVLVLGAVSRISHYAPVPGALGVYDAGMIAAAGWLELDPVVAVAYVLFTRLRDFVQVGAGFVFNYLPVGAFHAK